MPFVIDEELKTKKIHTCVIVQTRSLSRQQTHFFKNNYILKMFSIQAMTPKFRKKIKRSLTWRKVSKEPSAVRMFPTVVVVILILVT